ncbi:MAG: LLM class flavin-dependent oxidoreductase [Polyangiales bacterium]
MAALSFLDLVPILQTGTISQAAADIAVHAEALGYARYWVAEHHGMPGIGGAATAVVLAHVGAAAHHPPRRGRDHAPQPRASPSPSSSAPALHPGRIDAGLGRPGSDARPARALRRTLQSDPDSFPRDVVELQRYFAGDPQNGFVATPGAGADVALWILGSSTFGAQLAAHLGLPFAFASHFAPAAMDAALEIYRARFRPSARHAAPRAMVALNVFAAPTVSEARFLATSMQQSFVALRTGATPGRAPPPVEGYYERLPPPVRAMLDEVLEVTAMGTVDTVRDTLRALLARTRADEVIITSQIYDHDARKRSMTLAAEAAAQVSRPS